MTSCESNKSLNATKVDSREEIKSLNSTKMGSREETKSLNSTKVDSREEIKSLNPTKVDSREGIRSLNPTKGYLAKSFNHSMPQLMLQRRTRWEYKNHRHRSANKHLCTSGSVPFKFYSMLK